tara:strand:- start:36979 stop:37593 length:615 start_codon:yes stop_codon:yes gene_type:complete
MIIDPTPNTMLENYKLMTGLIVPRPIAWITTLSEGKKVNLAPFSAFTFVSHKPPMVAISIGRKDGLLKDTGNNILRDGECVVNISNQTLLDQLHASSARYQPEQSEVEALGMETLASLTVAPPRLAAAPASMECKLHFSKMFGDEQNLLVVAEVTRFHIADHLVNNGKVETVDLDPIARLGGPKYSTLGQILTMGMARVVESES